MMLFRHAVIRFVIGIISLIICVGLIRSLYTQLFRTNMVLEREQGYKREQQRNVELQAKLKEATSSAFIEKLAREKLGLVKEGDMVILLDTSRLKSDGSSVVDTKVSNWKAWVNLFF